MSIDIREIEDEIANIENSDTNWKNCEKLHILYAIRNQYSNHPQDKTFSKKEYQYSYANSEFTKIASEIPFEHLMDVLDEHFEIIKNIYPKEYKMIIKRLKLY